ncbi:MAG: Mu-like prophage major head subunit gpT family protein [Candidatus Izemoplasmatales bacterium]|nr:Mu-like prophage major head subunit gpT family protein [Candidatus Izemoplasmatales bacterium]
MDINRKQMDSLFEGFGQQFQTGLEMAPDSWTRFAGIVPSSTSSNVYPFIEQFGGMREWSGDRKIKSFASNKFEVVNKSYEDTIAVSRNDIEDDQYGIYGSLIAQMGLNAAKLWNDLSYETLTANGNWLDGKAFFATDHKYGSNTICNKSTSALTSTTFNTAYQTMMEYKGHSGKSLGVVPNLLVVGPKLRTTAWDIVKNEFSYSSADKVQVKNVNESLVDLLIAPELFGDYDDYWFLASTKGVIKPVMVQQRQMPKLTRLDNDGDENVFMRKEFIYGTDARGAAFMSMPHLIYAGIL